MESGRRKRSKDRETLPLKSFNRAVLGGSVSMLGVCCPAVQCLLRIFGGKCLLRTSHTEAAAFRSHLFCLLRIIEIEQSALSLPLSAKRLLKGSRTRATGW